MRIALPLFSFLASLSAFAQPFRQKLPESVIVHRDLAYVEDGHERQKLDLYLPREKKAPLPLIVWVHGGGWQGGSKDGAPPVRAGYVQRGYAVASINYRLSGHAVFPAQIEDCKAAIRWLRAHADAYGIDPKRFGVWGSSAGGHLVALLGTSGDVKEFDVGANLEQSSRVQAVCDYFGPSDFKAFAATPKFETLETANSPVSKLLGCAVSRQSAKGIQASPVTYASKDDPPFLIVHGDQDPVVPIEQSERLYDTLKSAGVSARLHTIHGAGHGGPGFSGPEVDKMVAAFFEARLMKGDISVEATVTECTADPTLMKPGPVGNRPKDRLAGRKISWEMIARREDKNGDGKVNTEEFSGPPGFFRLLDANGNGVISPEDWKDEASGAPKAQN